MADEPWPPDYVRVFMWRQAQLRRFRSERGFFAAAMEYYRTRPVEFIEDWVDTYDPRNAGQPGMLTRMPFVLFQRQRDLVAFIYACLLGETDGLVEKCRDAGVTWLCCAISVWLWLFWPGVAVGWGSRKEALVDKLGVVDSIFEKLRLIIRGLPPEMWPRGFDPDEHLTFMRILNPQNGAVIVGEAGDNIGRGGRTRVYFKDESAHYERPELIEAALGDNTRVQIDVSSVCGVGNVFHRKREAGVEWEGGDVVPHRTNVFVFDWSQHPGKTLEWYQARRAKWAEDGLLHIFAQEVDRDYSASVEGVIIPAEWVRSIIDAHVKLGFRDDGGYMGALDVADGGGDKNAWAERKGVVLKAAHAWGSVDTGVTTRRAIELAHGPVMYDCIGVGAGVKAESNRLREEGLMPRGIVLHPWNAGAAVLFPKENIIRKDKSTPVNEDHYLNLKAQAWWELRARVYRTWRAITEGVEYETSELISIDSSSIDKSTLAQLIKELSQATSSLSSAKMKLMVNKAPEGTRSPNLADAVVMAYWPVMRSRYNLENV